MRSQIEKRMQRQEKMSQIVETDRKKSFLHFITIHPIQVTSEKSNWVMIFSSWSADIYADLKKTQL